MGGPMKREILLSLSFVLAACGGQSTNPEPQTPVTPPTTTSAVAKTAEPPPPPAEPTPDPTPPTPPPPEKEATPDPCDGTWSCVKVKDGKVEKRTTKLVGDPKIEQTHSKITDGRNPADFDFYSKGAVEVIFRRKPGNKNEVVMKPAKGGEVVLDRRDGSIDDFSHIGVIAAEEDGAFLVDINYMK